MFFPFYNSSILILIPGILIAIWAQWKVKNAYNKWSQVKMPSRITGAEMAKIILNNNGLSNIPIKPTEGELTDNYNPINKTLNLSENVYNNDSVAAIGVAAHEAGHAIQHNTGYLPLLFRNGFFPIANFGSMLAFPLFILGIFMGYNKFLIDLGIWLFSAFVIFTIVTLPVEFNASKRAVEILTNSGALNVNELSGVKEVLSAAALTYVASALSALLNLLRLLIMSRGRD